jgi:cysteine desulfurase
MPPMAIYLDHAATTPTRPEVVSAILPYFGEVFGNPSSAHASGRRARAAIDEARDGVARALGADPREIVFTSGGTEAINLALKGAAWAGRASGHRIVSTPVEHHAVGHTLQYLEKFGFEVRLVGVDRYGRVDPEAVAEAVDDRTILVSVQLANNEVGTIQPVAEIVQRVKARRKGVIVHTDAVQAAPWLEIDVGALGVDLLSISGHKLEGPKGVGALFVRRGTPLLAQLQGGSQERYRRAGTENVPGIVGLAVALQLAASERTATVRRVRRLAERLRSAIFAVGGVEATGHPRERLPGIVSVVVPGVDGTAVVQALDLEGVAASVGSACTSGSAEPSHVLTAMGYPADEARGALRFSLGRTTSEEEIAEAVRLIPAVIARIREGEHLLAASPLAADPPAASPMEAGRR